MINSFFAVFSAISFAEDGEYRVTGGEAAIEGAWPDAAAIYFGNEVGCTGVLIAPDVVLTAAHCAEGITAVKLDTTDFERPGEKILAKRVVAYPKWARTYDVALVFLAQDAKVKPRMIAQDCVLDQFLTEGSNVAVVGYGATDSWGEEYGTSLQVGITKVVDPDCTDFESGCNREVSPAGEVSAGGNGVDACFGDSGGPLYLLTDDGAVLVGITSRGYDDVRLPCSEGGIYVRPDALLDWIVEELGESLPAPICEGVSGNNEPPLDDPANWGEGVVSMGYEVGVCGPPLDVGFWGVVLGASGWFLRRRDRCAGDRAARWQPFRTTH